MLARGPQWTVRHASLRRKVRRARRPIGRARFGGAIQGGEDGGRTDSTDTRGGFWKWCGVGVGAARAHSPRRDRLVRVRRRAASHDDSSHRHQHAGRASRRRLGGGISGTRRRVWQCLGQCLGQRIERRCGWCGWCGKEALTRRSLANGNDEREPACWFPFVSSGDHTVFVFHVPRLNKPAATTAYVENAIVIDRYTACGP
jgi:hypothetical protein